MYFNSETSLKFIAIIFPHSTIEYFYGSFIRSWSSCHCLVHDDLTSINLVIMLVIFSISYPSSIEMLNFTLVYDRNIPYDLIIFFKFICDFIVNMKNNDGGELF